MKPTIGPRELVYENRHYQVFRVPVQFPGFAKEIFVSEHGRRVGLVIARGEEVLLVRQYRLLLDDMAWEIPGGKVDSHETPAEAAIREGLEETCLRCTEVIPLLYFHPGLDTCNNPTYIFYSESFEEVCHSQLDTREVSGRVWLPLDNCIRMIFAGHIVDGLTVTALLAFRTLRHGSMPLARASV
jgi:8-oxo-dGTP pyrophosphatase MutT (NUDIX family)